MPFLDIIKVDNVSTETANKAPNIPMTPDSRVSEAFSVWEDWKKRDPNTSAIIGERKTPRPMAGMDNTNPSSNIKAASCQFPAPLLLKIAISADRDFMVRLDINSKW